jgi:uncharacterized protein (DUF433 family)
VKEKSTEEVAASSPTWETLEAFARQSMQQLRQRMLEEEVDGVLGRARYERREPIDAAAGYRNGFGKPRRLTLSNGTVTLRRPRMRGLSERFESQLLPAFKRRTEEVGRLLPELYLHGLAQGDFDLALRGLLGDGAPLSASSIARLKAGWQAEYDLWKTRAVSSSPKRPSGASTRRSCSRTSRAACSMSTEFVLCTGAPRPSPPDLFTHLLTKPPATAEGTVSTTVRLRRALRTRLEQVAARARRSVSDVAQELIEEGLRMGECAGIYFATEPSGRTAKISGTGLGVWEVLRDFVQDQDIDRVRHAFPQLSSAQINAALIYCKRYPDEIRRQVAANAALTAELLEQRYPGVVHVITVR